MSLPVRPHPAWMRWALYAAGVYNLAWGALVVLAPQTTLGWTGLDAQGTHALALWQCIGMIVGVYGVGYWIAASNPLVHWPVVLVGFLGKLFGPIGALFGWMSGTLPASMLLTNVANDFVWLPLFALILFAAWRAASERDGRASGESFSDALSHAKTSTGVSLAEVSRERPALVVFLRHFGCVFCREALYEIASRRADIEKEATIVLVHMSTLEEGAAFLARYGLDDAAHISDPSTRLYQAFGLTRATVSRLFTPGVLIRGAHTAFSGHGFGPIVGDVFQMPGVFLVHRGAIVKEFRHQLGSDRPDYVNLAACPAQTCGQAPG